MHNHQQITINTLFMREQTRDYGRLEHILTAIDYCIQFSEGKTLDDLNERDPLYFALVKNEEIIGEASYMLTQEFKDSHPATNWKQIIAMRNVLVHGYFDISKGHVWSVLQNDLPPLRKQVVEYLKEFEATEGLSTGN